MTDAFISYSRKDKTFVHKLHTAIEAEGRQAWVDWESIPLTTDWWAEIQEGIESTHTFVFVISPNSVASKVCAQEVEYANQHNKRIIPIVYRDVSPQELPAILSKLNWVFFRESDDFHSAFAALIAAMDTDYEWLKAHTRLIRRAVEWNKQSRDPSYLLRGTDLADAEQHLTQHDKEPALTNLQIEYILSSRQYEEAQHQKEIEAQEQSHKAGRRIIMIVLSLLLTILIIVVNYIGIKPAAHLIDLTNDVRSPAARTVADAERHLLLMSNDLRNYHLFGNKRYQASYSRNRQMFETHLHSLAELYNLSPGVDADGRHSIAELKKKYEVWRTQSDQLIGLPADQLKRTSSLQFSEGDKHVEQIQRLLAEMTNEQQQLLKHDLDQGSDGLERANQRSLFIGGLVTILGSIIIWIEIRGLPQKNRWRNLLGLRKKGG